MVQVSGGALTRTSSVASSIKIKSKFFGEIGSTQFLEQGFRPCSFFRGVVNNNTLVMATSCDEAIEFSP